MSNFQEQTNLINELRQKLEEAQDYINKIKDRTKKSYNKKFFTDKETLTIEEQQLKDERIKKRREYMNKRYHDIYKNKK